MNKLIAVAVLILLLPSCIRKKQNDFDRQIKNAVTRQMQTFPQSTLKDLYKSFFQDEFGPGHIIADTTAAGNYLRSEMNSYTTLHGPITEPLGWKGNYVRVNLSVLKTGTIPYDCFFDIFVRSVNGIKPVSVEEWKQEWSRIEAIIHTMNLDLPDYMTEKKEIEQHLAEGNYVGHHSSRYEEAYDPHYRIVSRELFEQELLPYLQNVSL